MSQCGRFFAVLVLAMSFGLSAGASIFAGSGSGKTIEGVVVPATGTVAIQGQEYPVDLIGAGLRTKTVLIAKVKVYVAALYSSDAGQFVRTENQALSSLKSSRTTVMVLTFLRTVDGPTVQQSFKDALNANQVSVTEPTLQAFLAAVSNGGDAEVGKKMVIALTKNANGSETLSYETSKGQVTTLTGGNGLTTQLMSIWLGQPADPGLSSLKSALIGGN